MKRPQFSPEKSCLLAVALSGLIIGAFLLSHLIWSVDNISSFGFCSLASAKARAAADYEATPIQLQSILHYATSKIVPQQSLAEISVTFDVLKTRSPCNFLVFGLGFDSLMWTSLNPHGTTLFLEEDPQWVQTIVEKAPTLNAHTVQYRTQLQEADSLLKNVPEWDLIMIDAPKGYFPEAPGRMAAIFSAVVMARGRKGSGVTHVFLHDVDRRVEKTFAEEFLCRKYLVKAVGRLWHFEIPAANVSQSGGWFC
ncbi:hypothetical protein OIU85_029153 [Salix viminalis]|uniref:Polysaccharide biosynthesis domain-containing protein n=1 Tax=Salix viminalis TaxID=40686 RepID=A0A9Q0QAN7_SALVM|nr:hypothetical protein OIU85_029153 [Salix viminalis]